MIARLQGTLLEKNAGPILLDVRGVGYELIVPLSTLSRLPGRGEEACLYTHLLIREDGHHLYGFLSSTERDLFRELIKVNGIGPKIALALLSSLDGDELLDCLIQERVNTLIRIPGVGRKTAERLILELRDRAEKLARELLPSPSTRSDPSLQVHSDAEAALIQLGYKPAEAQRALQAVSDDPDQDTASLLRRALKHLAGAQA